MNAVKEAYMKPNDFNKKKNSSFKSSASQHVDLAYNNFMNSLGLSPSTKLTSKNPVAKTRKGYDVYTTDAHSSVSSERHPKLNIEATNLNFQLRRKVTPKAYSKKSHLAELSTYDTLKCTLYKKGEESVKSNLKHVESASAAAESKDSLDRKQSRHEQSSHLGAATKHLYNRGEALQMNNAFSKTRTDAVEQVLSKLPVSYKKGQVQPTSRINKFEHAPTLKQKPDTPPRQKVVTEVKTFTQIVSPASVSCEDPLAAYFNRKDQYKIVVKKKLVEITQPSSNAPEEKVPRNLSERGDIGDSSRSNIRSYASRNLFSIKDEQIHRSPNKSKRTIEGCVSSKDKVRRVIHDSIAKKRNDRKFENASMPLETNASLKDPSHTMQKNTKFCDIQSIEHELTNNVPIAALSNAEEQQDSTLKNVVNHEILSKHALANTVPDVNSSKHRHISSMSSGSLDVIESVIPEHKRSSQSKHVESGTLSKAPISSCEIEFSPGSASNQSRPIIDCIQQTISNNNTVYSIEDSLKQDRSSFDNFRTGLEDIAHTSTEIIHKSCEKTNIDDPEKNQHNFDNNETEIQDTDDLLPIGHTRHQSASLKSADSPMPETPHDFLGANQAQTTNKNSNLPSAEREVLKYQNLSKLDSHGKARVVSKSRSGDKVKLNVELQTRQDTNAVNQQLSRNDIRKVYPVLRGAEKAVRDAIETYKKYFKDSSFENLSKMKNAMPRIILELPAEGVKEVYPLMIPIKPGTRDEEDKEEYNPITDLISTVEVIVQQMLSENLASHFGNEKEGIIRNLKKARNRKEGLEFVSAVRDFNVLMRKFKESGQIQACTKRIKVPSIELSNHILYQVYSRTVAPQADRLKEYEAFSNQVYGEINPILISEFIERTGIQSNHVFLDMGCGIGNVVLQVAAQTGCESHGIEIMDTPARLAKLQLKEFKARMKYYHLSHGHVNILHGDFLESPEIVDILRRVDVVLVNNYAFDSDLNQRLLQLFLDLKEGTKIITLKSYVPLDHKITLRNAASVESILTVQRYPYWSESVSWTNNGGEYFIHTVDRKPLHEFWKQVEENGGIDAATEGPVRRTTRSRK